jgi:phage terminase large subunit GpA-like protein
MNLDITEDRINELLDIIVYAAAGVILLKSME